MRRVLSSGINFDSFKSSILAVDLLDQGHDFLCPCRILISSDLHLRQNLLLLRGSPIVGRNWQALHGGGPSLKHRLSILPLSLLGVWILLALLLVSLSLFLVLLLLLLLTKRWLSFTFILCPASLLVLLCVVLSFLRLSLLHCCSL